MAHSASLLNSKSEFDQFLFAPVGEDKKGTIVSVLTAFARLDFDPWQKAADFVSLPRDVANTKLAAMIATLPGMSPPGSEPAAVAARLVTLLPSSARSAGHAQPIIGSRSMLGAIQAANLRLPRRTVLIILMMAMWVVAQIVWVGQPSQPSGSDPSKTSDTAGPMVQPSPTQAVAPPGIDATTTANP